MYSAYFYSGSKFRQLAWLGFEGAEIGFRLMNSELSSRPQRPFSRRRILRQHARGCIPLPVALDTQSKHNDTVRALEAAVDSVQQRLVGGTFSTVVVDRGFSSLLKPTNLSYEITRGSEASMADKIVSRPASRAESPFGAAGSRFGSRRQTGRQYFCNDGKPYFGQDEVFEDQLFLLSHQPHTARQCQTAESGNSVRMSSSRVDSEASLALSTRTLEVLRNKALTARQTAKRAAARKKVKRTRTSAASQAARDDSVYDTLPRRMVRRLKAMEAATASTAFGASGGRYDKGVLGVSNDTLRQVDRGPGMYSDADTASIAAKLKKFERRAAQRSQSARLRRPSSGETESNVPVGGIGFLSAAPGVGSYSLPQLPPVGYAVQWSSQPRWGRGSLGHVDKANAYKLSSTAGCQSSPAWILPSQAPFSKVDLHSRNPMFDKRRENRNIPYASAPGIAAPPFWDYPSVVQAQTGLAQTVGARDIYKSARMSKAGSSRSLGKLSTASDIAGLGPGSYGIPLDRKLTGAFQVQHIPPRDTKKAHWLTHTSGDWKLRY